MGSVASKMKLVIATLNYSGIIASPYQFYEQLKGEQRQLNNIFNKLSEDYFKMDETFSWSFGTIDKHWHSRFCPLYTWNVGIKTNKTMMNRRQFLQQWINCYNKAEESAAIIKDLQVNMKQKKYEYLQEYLSTFFKNEKAFEKHFPSFKEQMKLIKNEKKQKKRLLSEYTAKFINEIVIPAHKQRHSKIKEVLQIKQDYIFAKTLTNNSIRISNATEASQLYQAVLFQMMMFDYIAYKAILIHIYKDKIENIEEKDGSKFIVEGKQYRKKRKQKFSKTFLREDLKIKQTIKLIRELKIDIFFMQQATKQLIKNIEAQLPNYRIVHPIEDKSQWSIIVIREDKFPKVNSLRIQNRIFFQNIKQLNPYNIETQNIDHQLLKNLNVNDDTVVQAIGNIILIGSHLSSKKQKNPDQLKKFTEVCANIKNWFHDADPIIIAGADLNGNFVQHYNNHERNSNQAQKLNFFIFPNDQKCYTTNKIRTNMQAQRNKAHRQGMNIKPQIPKDYLISNRQMKNLKIRTFYDQQSIFDQNGELRDKDMPLIPNQKHPFDHYLLIGEIQINQKQIQHIGDISYKYKFSPQTLNDDQLKQYHNENKS